MIHEEQPDLALDLMNDTEIRERVKESAFAHKLYAALCNTEWQHTDVLEILKNHSWSASWRSAGAIVADLRSRETYLDWYCSGHEGYVHPDIEAELRRLGWVCIHREEPEEFGGHPREDLWGHGTGIAGAINESTVTAEFLATIKKDIKHGPIQ